VDLEAARDRAAQAAVAHVADGMLVGLGSGDTAARAIRMLGERRLHLQCVATSERSATVAREVGLVVRTPDDLPMLDLTIDGADEIDGQLRLIKGGGGAHTREKLVARASRQLIIVADSQKRVRRLGERMRLPVEILRFGSAWTMARLRGLGVDPQLRGGGSVQTDNGNLLCDCALPSTLELRDLAARLKALPGVVEHGLFLDEASIAYVGTATGVDRLTR
jgi:ribose 5-phosphate isomerase A